MTQIRFPLLLITAAVLLLGLGAVACDDDDDDGDGNGGAATEDADGSLTLESYLREVNEIQEGVTEATDAIGEQGADAFSDPARARQSLSAAIDVAESAVTALEELNPPEEASAAHDELIAAGDNLAGVATDLNSQLQGMEAGAEFDEFVDEAQSPDSELSAAINRMSQACESMVVISEEEQAGVDLDCPEPVS